MASSATIGDEFKSIWGTSVKASALNSHSQRVKTVSVHDENQPELGVMTMRSKTKLKLVLLVAGGILFGATSDSGAATVTVNSVNGVWTSTNPTNGITGVGSNEIRWGGIPIGGSNQSGFKFEGATPGGTYAVNEQFDAGVFTHFNFPTNPPSLSSATLLVDFDVTIQNGQTQNRTLSSVFDFDLFETNNDDDPCADGNDNRVGVNINGCADRVRFNTNTGVSDIINVDGVPYLLELTGFVIDNNPATEFWTIEDATNTAVVTGSMSVVPVPAALPLLLTALGALGILGRKKMKGAAAA